MKPITKPLAWLTFFVAISCVTLLIQHSLPMHEDNAFFIYAAQKWLAGGTYVRDFLDTNPPLIILLNVPVVLLAKVTQMDARNAFYLYILCLALTMLAWSCYLAKKIISDRVTFYLLTAMLAFVLLILPNGSFGQRENLWVMFSLPYLFSIVLDLSGRNIAISQRIAAGVVAGVGFALKPQFLIVFILQEVFFACKRRHIFAWLRAESLCILGVLALYALSILLYFPDYVYTVVPLLKKYYDTTQWYLAYFNPHVFYSSLMMILYGMTWRQWRYPVMSQVFMLALLGSTLSFLIGHINIFYHAIPPLSFSLMLAAFMLADVSRRIFCREADLALIMQNLAIYATGLAVLIVFPFVKVNMLRLTVYQFPVILLALLACFIFSTSLKKIIDAPIACVSLLMTLVLMLFFSATPFPQEQQLYLVLLFPYFCGIMTASYNRPFGKLYACVAGVLAGCAIHLNHSLLLPFLLMECFFLAANRKNKSDVLRLELLVFLGVFYGLSKNIFQPVLGMAGIHLQWLMMIKAVAALLPREHDAEFFKTFNFSFCGLVLLLFFMSWQKAKYRLLNSFFCVAMLGFSAYAWLINKSGSLHVVLPAIIMAGLLVVLIMADILRERCPHAATSQMLKNGCRILTVSVAAIFLCYYPLQLVAIGNSSITGSLKEGPDHSLAVYLNAYPGSTYDYYALDDTLMGLGAFYHHQFVGKSPMLWWYPILSFQLKQAKSGKTNAHAVQQTLADAAFFIDGLAAKLDQAKPRFVILQLQMDESCSVEIKAGNKTPEANTFDLSNSCHNKINPDNFITLFSTNANFSNAWLHYRHLTDVEYDDTKYYEIYERVS